MHPCGGWFHRGVEHGDLLLLLREWLAGPTLMLSVSLNQSKTAVLIQACNPQVPLIHYGCVKSMREKARSGLLGSSPGSWCMVSDGCEITAARHSHSSAVKGDWKFPLASPLPLWLHDRNWGAWGGCSGTVLTEELPSRSEARETQSYKNLAPLCLFSLSSCSIALQNVSVALWGNWWREGKRGCLVISLSLLDCQQLEVNLASGCSQRCLSPVRGGTVGVNRGLGWLWLTSLQRGLDQELCYELLGKVWEAPATSSGHGDSYEQAVSGGSFTHEALIHHPFVRQHLCPAV